MEIPIYTYLYIQKHTRLSKSKSAQCVSGFICRVQTLSTLWHFVWKVSYVVSLYRCCTVCLVYKYITQSIFSIFCSDCVNYCLWKSFENYFFNYSNSCCTLRTYLFIYVLFISWLHWKDIYLNKWFTLKCNIWFEWCLPCFKILTDKLIWKHENMSLCWHFLLVLLSLEGSEFVKMNISYSEGIDYCRSHGFAVYCCICGW